MEDNSDDDKKSISQSMDAKITLKTDPPRLAKLCLSPRVTDNFRVNYSTFDIEFVKDMLQHDKFCLKQKIQKTHFAPTSEFGEAVIAQIMQAPNSAKVIAEPPKVVQTSKKRRRKKKKHNAQAHNSSNSQ